MTIPMTEKGALTESIQVIGALHCELPLAGNSGRGGRGTSSSGTLDLGDVQTDDPTISEVITLKDGQSLRLGRARVNDLVVDHPGVSRMHAVFSASRNGIVVFDLSSLNGTFLNGRRISTPTDLNHGDVVKIGSVKITVELERAVVPDEETDTVIDTRISRMTSAVVTVLVADVCGYTRLSQALPAQDVATMLNRWFERVVDTIMSEGGEIDKYIGDCVMAIWRAPQDNPAVGALRAVRAAEQILAETERLRSEGHWQHEVEFPWGCRVAINTGEVLSGAVGPGGAREYTVLGDTVNVAFRLESVGSQKGVALIVSEGTANYLGDALPLQSLGPVILEGRRDNVEIFTLETGRPRN